MTQLSLVKEKGQLHIAGYTADQISNLLAEKHKLDVFVAQCKNGETLGARKLLILDAWALKRTYSPLSMIGYEIKVDRQDFEHDQKWIDYTDLCHYFYFVCPAGLIRSTELPHQIGLIWVSQSGVLHTKHKAERQNLDITKTSDLLTYIVMARSKIVDNSQVLKHDNNESRFDEKRKYVEQSKARGELAYFIKGYIKDEFKRLQELDGSMKRREDRITRFEQQLAKLGITWDSNNDTWQDSQRVENEINVLKNHLDPWKFRQLQETVRVLTNTIESLKIYYAKDNANSGLG